MSSSTKGSFTGYFSEPAEDGVFKDMGYAGGVFRGGAERRAEALVLVVVDYGEQFRSGGVVPPQFDGAGNFGKPFLAHEAKAAGIHLGLLILHERLGERARRAGAHFPSGPPLLRRVYPGALQSVHMGGHSRPAAITRKNNAMVFP